MTRSLLQRHPGRAVPQPVGGLGFLQPNLHADGSGVRGLRVHEPARQPDALLQRVGADRTAPPLPAHPLLRGVLQVSASCLRATRRCLI